MTGPKCNKLWITSFIDPAIVFILAVPERRDAEGEGGGRPGGRGFKKAGGWGQQGGRGKEVSRKINYPYAPLSEVLCINWKYEGVFICLLLQGLF